MRIRFLGAAGSVTGSCHVIDTGASRFAIDCGMHQGSSELERRNQDIRPYRPKEMDFFLVTHAHIDHTGLLPRMVKFGFGGAIYCTAPTADLLAVMLEDSARIQVMEAEWQSRKAARRRGLSVEPLYTVGDAAQVIPLIRRVEYGEVFSPAPGIKARYSDAGHILGSAFIELWIEEEGKQTKLVFSGDIGRADQLLMSDPTRLTEADYLFMEGTYGDREHKDPGTSREEFAAAIDYSYKRGGKVIIPAFAVERTQEVLYCLHLLSKQGKLPPDMPVFVDSPLAIKATEIFRRHPEYLDKETNELLNNGQDPLTVPGLRYTLSTDESRNINAYPKPAIVISAAGMCNAGRIKHHLRHNLWRPESSIVFVGYQGVGTPGRKIVDGAKSIRILGEDVAVAAKVFTIGGFSAHAGQSQLLSWVSAFTGRSMEVFLLHGEQKALSVFSELIRRKLGLKVRVPNYQEEFILRPGATSAEEGIVLPVPAAVDLGPLLNDAAEMLKNLLLKAGELRQRGESEQLELAEKLAEINRQLHEVVD